MAAWGGGGVFPGSCSNLARGGPGGPLELGNVGTHVGGTVWSLGGGPWPLEPPPCPCANPTMIQGGPVAMPLTPSCQRQAGGPVYANDT